MTTLRLVEAGAARGDARLAAILLHGRGQQPEDIAGLAQALGFDDIFWLLPEAPGNTWYPHRFIEPLALNQPHFDRSLAAVSALADGLNADGFGDGRIVLGGFSQGACLAAELLMRRPAAYAAGLIFTGGLIGPPGTSWPGRMPPVPVLLTGGDLDEWVPAWRTRETGAALVAAGAKAETVIYPDRPHTVSRDEITRARTLLGRV